MKSSAKTARKGAGISQRLLYPIRLLSVVAAGSLGAYLMFLLMVKVVHPYKLGYEESRKVADLKAKLARQQARNAELRAQVNYLEDEEGAESEARRAGFHKPGEIVFLLDQNAISYVQSQAGSLPKAKSTAAALSPSPPAR